jgi:hypothetical protein
VSLLGDSELAVSESVPELNGSIARSGNDLPVVGREGNGENVVGVSDKSAGGGTGGKLPEAESLVPGSREGVGTVRGDDLKGVSVQEFQWSPQFLINPNHRRRTYTVRNDVRVAMQRSLWVTVGSLIAGQVPDDEGLVAGTRQQHIWVFERGREGGNPSAMTLKGSLENELFRHVEGSFGRCSIDLRRRFEEGIQNLEIRIQCGISRASLSAGSAEWH